MTNAHVLVPRYAAKMPMMPERIHTNDVLIVIREVANN